MAGLLLNYLVLLVQIKCFLVISKFDVFLYGTVCAFLCGLDIIVQYGDIILFTLNAHDLPCSPYSVDPS